jgi:hypothetical protein
MAVTIRRQTNRRALLMHGQTWKAKALMPLAPRRSGRLPLHGPAVECLGRMCGRFAWPADWASKIPTTCELSLRRLAMAALVNAPSIVTTCVQRNPHRTLLTTFLDQHGSNVKEGYAVRPVYMGSGNGNKVQWWHSPSHPIVLYFHQERLSLTV